LAVWQLGFERLGIKLGGQDGILVDSMRTAPYPNLIFFDLLSALEAEHFVEMRVPWRRA
jgi:hypothetical protein